RTVSFGLTSPPTRSTFFPYTTLFRSTDRSEARRRGGIENQLRVCVRLQKAGDDVLGLLAFGRLLYDRSLVLSQRHADHPAGRQRSEEHTSELQSRENLVCRLLLEKKN